MRTGQAEAQALARPPLTPTWLRWLSALLAVGAAMVLALSFALDPDPAGHGTHLQLGLSSCSILQLTGLPCPMCGATTTFALMSDLRVLEAIWNQPFAATLYLLTWTLLLLSSAEALVPRGRWIRLLARIEPVEGRLAVAFVGGMFGGWIWKVILMDAWKPWA